MNVPEEEYFLGDYVDWRNKRIAKIESIFGKDFFQNKTMLELGCGYGYLGKYFHEELGSDVTFAEGNKEFLPWIQKINPNASVIHLDQDTEYNLDRKFDVVVHFGVLYHLDDWKQDLICATQHTDLLLLESEVANTEDPEFELKYTDYDHYDQALNRIATRPSANSIESVLRDMGFSYTRYDDADLNSGNHIYSWVVNEDAKHNWQVGQRRFWVAKRV
jgi:SAM-dependent methyltransferase